MRMLDATAASSADWLFMAEPFFMTIADVHHIPPATPA